MTRAIMACCLSIAMLLLTGIARGQSFDFSFSTSTGSYQTITGATTVASGYNWNYSNFRIPIGFSFTFAGESFDSLNIDWNGFVKFDDNRAITLFMGAACTEDTSNSFSLLSYSLTGSSGNRILKIQYTNCDYNIPGPSTQYLNYQLWLYEQGEQIEIHTGPTSYPQSIDENGTSPSPVIGLINPLMDWSTSALLLSGVPSAPTAGAVSPGNDLYYLDYVPANGTVYVFVPNGN